MTEAFPVAALTADDTANLGETIGAINASIEAAIAPTREACADLSSNFAELFAGLHRVAEATSSGIAEFKDAIAAAASAPVAFAIPSFPGIGTMMVLPRNLTTPLYGKGSN